MDPYILATKFNDNVQIAEKLRENDKKTNRIYFINFLVLILLSVGMFAIILAVAVLNIQNYLIYLGLYTLLALLLISIIVVINVMSATKRRDILNYLKTWYWTPVTSPFDDTKVFVLMIFIIFGTLGTIFLFSILSGDFGDPVLIGGAFIMIVVSIRTIRKRNARLKYGYPVIRYFNARFEDAVPRILEKLDEFSVFVKFKGSTLYQLKIMGPALEMRIFKLTREKISVEIKPIKEENLPYAKKIAEIVTESVSPSSQNDDAQL